MFTISHINPVHLLYFLTFLTKSKEGALMQSLLTNHLFKIITDVIFIWHFLKYFLCNCFAKRLCLEYRLYVYMHATRLTARSHSLNVDQARCDHHFHSKNLSSQTFQPIWCFSDSYKLQTFKRKFNRHHLSSWTLLLFLAFPR